MLQTSRRIAEIQKQNSEAITKLESQSKAYFSERDKRCADLEELYQNKLRIEKPADYWKEMSVMYAKKGKLWLLAGCACGIDRYDVDLYYHICSECL